MVHIPERFARTVTVHILKNILDFQGYEVPLILGIHGPAGEGKTFMCEHVLRNLGVKSYLISGGQLESEDAGKPAALLRQTYLKAGEDIQNGKALMATVLINDFDTGVGNWGKIVQFTVNTQQIFAELMHLCDYPEIVEGKKALRIPIILTGNFFGSLHLPLLRTGRMWLFQWCPTIDEKSSILQDIFPLLSRSEIQQLAKRFEKQPVSFFTHLKGSLLDEQIWNLTMRFRLQDVVRKVRMAQDLSIGELTQLNNLAAIIKVGTRIETEAGVIDHLKGKKE